MRTADARGVQSGGWLTTRQQALLVTAAAFLCLIAVPAEALASSAGPTLSSAPGDSPPPGSEAALSVHIYASGTGSEVGSGRVSIDNAAGIASSANPVLNFAVAPGRENSVSATAPAGWTFVNNASQPDTITNAGTAASLTDGVTVLADHSGTIVFLVVPVRVPACAAPPCGGPVGAQLTLTETVDKSTAPVGGTVTYTISVGNTGLLAATAVTVDDLLGGDAGYLVDDGTSATANSFVGAPVVTITKVLSGHYRWSYPVVNPGDSDIVRFSAVIRLPGAVVPNAHGVITLSSTASTPGVPAATVTTNAPYAGGSQAGGVQGVTTNVPPTGSNLNASVGGFLFLGGIGLILIGVLARKLEELAG